MYRRSLSLSRTHSLDDCSYYRSIKTFAQGQAGVCRRDSIEQRVSPSRSAGTNETHAAHLRNAIRRDQPRTGRLLAIGAKGGGAHNVALRDLPWRRLPRKIFDRADRRRRRRPAVSIRDGYGFLSERSALITRNLIRVPRLPIGGVMESD